MIEIPNFGGLPDSDTCVHYQLLKRLLVGNARAILHHKSFMVKHSFKKIEVPSLKKN